MTNTDPSWDSTIMTTAEAYDIHPSAVTMNQISYFGARQQLLSDLATLLENGFDEAVEGLLELHDIDIECMLDLAALRGLACQNIAMRIGVIAEGARLGSKLCA